MSSPRGWVHAHTRWVKHSPRAREERKWQALFQPLSHCLAAPRMWKHGSDESYLLLLLNIYYFKQKRHETLFPKCSRGNSSSGSYSCKSKITAVPRELKMCRGEEIHSIASVAVSITRCRLMLWMIPNPVSAHRGRGFNGCHRVLCSCS